VSSTNSSILCSAGDRIGSPGPYLIRRASDRDDCVSVIADKAARVIEVAVRGRWSPALRIATWSAVNSCLVGHPRAIIVDLQGLADPLAASTAAWWTVHGVGAGMRPSVQVAVRVAPGTALASRLNRLDARRRVLVFASLHEARDAVATRGPAGKRVQLHLAPRPEAPQLARALVADACRAWQLAALSDRARLVAYELTENAVRHAGTDMLVTVSRRAAGIHLTVSDGNPLLPTMLSPLPPGRPVAAEGGRGLLAVHATASLWGAMPAGAGKVVWATLLPWTPGPARTGRRLDASR
jgi:hypothetical protein